MNIWQLTQTPPKSRFPGGTGNGAIVMLPPEVDLSDYASGFTPAGITNSTSYFIACRTWFAAGNADPRTGSIDAGYSWGADTNGTGLVFRNHNLNIGTNAIDITERVRFTQNGRIVWGPGESTKSGILTHANAVADRTYTFPDKTGTVGILPIVLTSDVSGVLPIANGGTNSSTALNNSRIMVSSAGAVVEAGAMTNGQLLIGSTGAAPVVASLTAGSGITVTPGAGSITIAASGGSEAAANAVLRFERFL